MRSSDEAIQNRSRSGSAYIYPTIRLKRQRVDKSQDLNRLRKSIKDTFEAEEKSYNQIKELTSKVSPVNSRRINQMCLKYSICSNPRKRKTQAEDIDVESIAKSYINSKSKEKRKELLKKQMKKAIGLASRRYEDTSSPQFLKRRNENVRKNDKFHTEEDHVNDRRYLTIYQKSQAEVISKVVKQHRMELDQIDECPQLVEIDEWEREQRKMKEVYATVKNLRAKTTKYRQRMKDKEQATGSFYIT